MKLAVSVPKGALSSTVGAKLRVPPTSTISVIILALVTSLSDPRLAPIWRRSAVTLSLPTSSSIPGVSLVSSTRTLNSRTSFLTMHHSTHLVQNRSVRHMLSTL
jgi:hypothetical protein